MEKKSQSKEDPVSNFILFYSCKMWWDEICRWAASRGTRREKKSLGGIIQKPGRRHNRQQLPPQSDYITRPTPSPIIAYNRERKKEEKKKMNSLRAVSRVALRAKPTRSLFAATRTYADAAGPADKIRLSLALPHQVRGHSTVGIVLWMRGDIPGGRAIADVEGAAGRLSTKLRMCTFCGPSSSSSPHFVSKWRGVYKTTNERGRFGTTHPPPSPSPQRKQCGQDKRMDGSEKLTGSDTQHPGQHSR